MAFQTVFKRYEIKFKLNGEQREAIEDAISEHMRPDAYPRSSIYNIYFDTENYLLARRSLEKPMYKEKLRLRSYGMPQDGNSDKGEYSTKGIKADNSITISGGTVTVTNSYEGLEGSQVVISGGNVSVRSSDDGINATATSGVGIRMSDGHLYVYAGGDGLDSNSRTSKAGIYFEGGTVVVVSTSGGNSCIDTEAGYTYSGGSVLAICPSGMTQEVQNYAISGSGKATVKSNLGSLSSGTTVTATAGSSVLAVKLPASVSNAFAIYLGSSSATITSGSSSYSFDSNGVYSS